MTTFVEANGSDKAVSENATSLAVKKAKKVIILSRKRPANDIEPQKGSVKKLVPKIRVKKPKNNPLIGENEKQAKRAEKKAVRAAEAQGKVAKKEKHTKRKGKSNETSSESECDHLEPSPTPNTARELPTKIMHNGEEVEIGYIDGIPVKKSDAIGFQRYCDRITDTSLPMKHGYLAKLVGKTAANRIFKDRRRRKNILPAKEYRKKPYADGTRTKFDKNRSQINHLFNMFS